MIMRENRKKKAIEIIKKLPERKVAEIIDFLEYINQKYEEEVREDRTWLDASLENFPPYDWGEEGPPKGKPVKYVPGIGLIVEGGRPNEQ